MARRPPWSNIATDPIVLRRALLTSLVVGVVLTLANHGDEVVPVLITFLVPFAVSLVTSVLAIGLHRRTAESGYELLEREIQAINLFPGQNPNPVLRTDEDGTLTYANASAAPILAAWDRSVGERLPAPTMLALVTAAAESPPGRIEVVHERQTFSILTVHVPELGVYNLYGTDVTANKVVERFPDRNPNPVLRMTPAGTLRYANAASTPIAAAARMSVGEPLPPQLLESLERALADPGAPDPEVPGEGGRTYRIKPVPIPEFDFINLYGTDITAAREVEKLNAENERLLLNILPASIAERLRGGETVIADRFDDMTVLFADVVGFTELSSRMPPDDVVKLLNEIFSLCDRLADRFGLEKIKTVGDAYMVVGGLHHDVTHPESASHDSHAADVADMGLVMLRELAAFSRTAAVDVQVRIGMQVGPAVAGVIGLKKFIYDVWGDTVNTASRMESTGVPGRIQVTRETYERLRDDFEFEPRGPIDVKGKGRIETWFLLGRRSITG